MSTDAHRPDLRRIGERACTEVLEILLSLPVTVRDLSGQNTPSSVSDHITGSVPLAGERLAGSLRLHLPLAFVRHAVRLLTGPEAVARYVDAVLDDAAGELANMVAGRVAAQLAAEGYPCKLDTPSVSRSSGWPLEHELGADYGRAGVICDGHSLCVEVQCRYAKS